MSARISACVLTYNHAAVVGESVASVLRQDAKDFEVIISDDCSTDRTVAAVEEAAAGDPRVRVVRPPRNLGMAGNANFAVAQTSAPHVALLHHDDLYAPELLRRWSEVLDAHPSVGFVSTAYRSHLDGSVDLHPLRELNPGREVLERLMLPRWGCPVRGTAMIRRSAWDAVGGMRERFGMLADVDLWMRLAARFDVGYVAEPLITVRHARPEDYPDAYVSWSWKRLRIGHDIYGTNHLDYYGRDSLRGRLRQAHYRARVNVDIARWLGYGLVKRRPAMLLNAHEVASSYEYAPTRAVRQVLGALAQHWQ